MSAPFHVLPVIFFSVTATCDLQNFPAPIGQGIVSEPEIKERLLLKVADKSPLPAPAFFYG